MWLRCHEFKGYRVFRGAEHFPSMPSVLSQSLVWWPLGKQADYEVRLLSGDCEITMRKILGLNPDLDVAGVLNYDGESQPDQQPTLQDLLRHGTDGQTVNTETQGWIVYQNPVAMRQAVGDGPAL